MSIVYSNIFEVGNEDNPEQAKEMLLRSDLMRILSQIVREKKWTQAEAASQMKLNQPQVSDIMNWRVEKLTSQRLLKCLFALGFNITPKLNPAQLDVALETC